MPSSNEIINDEILKLKLFDHLIKIILLINIYFDLKSKKIDDVRYISHISSGYKALSIALKLSLACLILTSSGFNLKASL